MRILIVFLLIILALPFFSAVHDIRGIVNDAFDGREANDLEVVLWNPLNGLADNLTDIIGENGNSAENNSYLIDCENLNSPCNIGDTIKIKVFSYPFSVEVSILITGGTFDVAENLTLNSVPVVNPVLPIDYTNTSLGVVNFNCTFNDLDLNIANVSLYGNWSGGWHLNETKSVSGEFGSVLFSKILEGGIYTWGCLVTDELSVSAFSENNFTINIDRTKPELNSVLINESFVCGESNFVRVTCNTNDSSGISNVIIEVTKPNQVLENYSTIFLSGNDYYFDVPLDQIGLWEFNCISFDYANNSANLSVNGFESYSDLPDLIFYPQINFSNLNPLEGENIFLNATILNKGCSDANDFLVGVYENEPYSEFQIGDNITLSVAGRSSQDINVSWESKIGPINFFFLADIGFSIGEFNESNNGWNQTLDVGVWQEFYGNVSGIKLLSDKLFYNFSLWGEDSNLNGNIFIADMESEIDWSNLFSIGRKKSGLESDNDFDEIDSFLNMVGFQDSVKNIFTLSGEPILMKNLSIHGMNILNVPVINSTNNSNFMTGLLWDGSDDTDGEYGGLDKEDLIFVAELNKSSPGTYGVYDYELRVPVNLRNYETADIENVYLYYDLI